MDLTRAVRAKSFMLEPDADHGYRLVVDLYSGSGGDQAPGQRIAQRAPEMSEALTRVLHLTQGGGSGTDGATTDGKSDRAVLHVAQSASESSGTVTRTPR